MAVKPTQAELERDMAQKGEARYASRRAKAEARSLETTTPTGQWLLQNAVDLLSVRIISWRGAAKAAPGRRHKAVVYYELLPEDLTAALIARVVLDSISQRKLFTRTAMQIASILEDECRYICLADTDPEIWRIVKKRVSDYMGYACKRRHIVRLMNQMEHEFVTWSRYDKMQIGTVALQLMAESTGLIEIVNRRTIFGKTRVEVVATDKTVRWLEQSHARSAILRPVYLPCVEPPKDWINPFVGGYHTPGLHKRTLIKAWDKAYLVQIKDDPMPEVYSAVNRIQATEFRVNPWMLQVMEHFWSKSIEIAGIPQQEDIEIPPAPADIEENEEARKTWRRQAAVIHRLNAATRAERVTFAKIIFLANEYLDRPMSFVAQLDWRGRYYATSYHLHFQGPDHVKALLLFDKGATLDDAVAVRWFKIHGANCWGLTKASYDERVQWVDENKELLLAIADDPYTNRQWEDADEPWQFAAFCNEYAQWIERGTAYVSYLPIALDATQSGIQLFSLLLRDEVGGAATNCVPSIASDPPEDLYQRIANKVIEILESQQDEVAAARMWLEFGITRSCVKRPVMTRPYNAQLFSAMKYVREWAMEESKAGKGELPTENDYRASLYLARTIWAAMDEVISGAQGCLKWFAQVAKICAHMDGAIWWTTPTGFQVKQDYRKYKSRSVKTRIGDTIRQHKLRDDTEALDRRKMVNGLAPNYIHSLDASLLFKVVNAAAAQGVDQFAVVHDSFATLAADTECLAQAIRKSAADMFSEDLLGIFKKEVEALLPPDTKLPPLPKYGSLDPSGVRDSQYFFN